MIEKCEDKTFVRLKQMKKDVILPAFLNCWVIRCIILSPAGVKEKYSDGGFDSGIKACMQT